MYNAAMKKLVAWTLVLLSIGAAFTAGSALAHRQGVHIVKIGPPIIPPSPPAQPNPPLTGTQLVNVLRQANFKVNTVGGPAHFDSGHLYVNSGNFVLTDFASINPVPAGSIALPMIGNQAGSVQVCHSAKANTPFVVDFQVAPRTSSLNTSAVTNANGSIQTWTFNSPTHAIVVVYPTSSGSYLVSLTNSSNVTIVTGIDVSDVTS